MNKMGQRRRCSSLLAKLQREQNLARTQRRCALLASAITAA